MNYLMRLQNVPPRTCTIKLDKEPIIEYLNSNIVLLKYMIAEGYGDTRTLERRIRRNAQWLDNPQLLEADKDAEYAGAIEIDMNGNQKSRFYVHQMIRMMHGYYPKQGDKIDEVFIRFCMTIIFPVSMGKLLGKFKDMIPTSAFGLHRQQKWMQRC